MFDDMFGGFAQGAGTGAGLGMMAPQLGGPLIGAAVGGGLGLLGGALSGWRKKKSNDDYKKRLDQQLSQLAAERRMAWDQRMGDLDKIMGFYGPAVQAAQQATGMSMPMPTFKGQPYGGGR